MGARHDHVLLIECRAKGEPASRPKAAVAGATFTGSNVQTIGPVFRSCQQSVEHPFVRCGQPEVMQARFLPGRASSPGRKRGPDNRATVLTPGSAGTRGRCRPWAAGPWRSSAPGQGSGSSARSPRRPHPEPTVTTEVGSRVRGVAPSDAQASSQQGPSLRAGFDTG